jgi:RNA polymerase sigma-70 factor (ECF subfamily)
VFKDCAPVAWRALRHLGVAEADLKDVSQEVFLVVHRKLPTFDGRSTLRSWVYGICVRVASDYRRAARRRREVLGEDVPELSLPASQHEQLEQGRALAWLDGVLETLDESKRAVFVLFDMEELPMTEVAHAVGCPIKTAYARLYAARKHVEVAAAREQAKRGSGAKGVNP